MYTVNSDFDIDKHADNFIDYLEVVISPEGKVRYAVPSHTQCLDNILRQQCKQDGRDYYKIIKDNIYNYPNCLCDLTGYCMLWNEFMYKPSAGLTKAQEETIYKLMTKHYTKMPHLSLYQGTL